MTTVSMVAQCTVMGVCVCVHVYESKTCPNHFSPAPGDPGVHRAVQAPGGETKFNIQVPNKVQVRMLRGVGERWGGGVGERWGGGGGGGCQKCPVRTCLDPSPFHTLTPSHPHILTRFEEVGEEQVIFKMISENGSKVRRPD